MVHAFTASAVLHHRHGHTHPHRPYIMHYTLVYIYIYDIPEHVHNHDTLVAQRFHPWGILSCKVSRTHMYARRPTAPSDVQALKHDATGDAHALLEIDKADTAARWVLWVPGPKHQKNGRAGVWQHI